MVLTSGKPFSLVLWVWGNNLSLWVCHPVIRCHIYNSGTWDYCEYEILEAFKEYLVYIEGKEVPGG